MIGPTASLIQKIRNKMFFYLTDSLITDETDPRNIGIFRSVRNIVEAVEESSHMLYGDFSALCFFSRVFQSERILGPLLDKLVQNYSTFCVPPQITYYIEVVAENPLPPRVEGNVTIGQIEYTDFSNRESLAKTSLIGENDYDCFFYRFVLKWYLESNGFRFHYSFSDINGGGSSTDVQIKKEIDKKHVSICFVDTDCRFPGDVPKPGSCFKKCERLGQKRPFYKFVPLNVHEIENLIPINFIDACDCWVGELRDPKDRFDRIKNSPEIMQYFDYKQGVPKPSEKGGPQYEYGRKLFNAIADKRPGITYEEYCDALGDDLLYPPLTGRVLLKVLDLIKMGRQEAPVLFDYQIDMWNEIGENMLNWGVARNLEGVY